MHAGLLQSAVNLEAALQSLQDHSCRQCLPQAHFSAGLPAAWQLTACVQVFIHDPLYSWAMTEKKADRAGDAARAEDAGGHGGGSAIINADAERAILRIDLKLRVRSAHQPLPCPCSPCVFEGPVMPFSSCACIK